MTRKFTEIENSGKAYVYEHWRPDTGQCFWVGKGTSFRYRVYKRRANSHYNSIVAKLRAAGRDVEVRFIAVNLTDEEAFTVEIDRMAFWRSQNVTLANKSEGGQGGMSGVKRSDAARKKQSETLQKRRAERPVKVKEVRPRVPSRMRGTKLSAEHRVLLKASKTPEVRARISAAAQKQWENPVFRKIVSDTMKRTNAARRSATCVA